MPLFVLTHAAPPDPPPSDPPYTFVTAGIVEAIAQAKQAAGDQRVVALMGSGPVRGALASGLLDQITLHVVPVLLGGGVRLLDGSAAGLRVTEVVDAPGVTHLTYEVLR